MKKIKNGTQYCQFGQCAGNKVKAICRSSGLTLREYACEEHKNEIKDRTDDGYMSEGDYQSWGRLR